MRSIPLELSVTVPILVCLAFLFQKVAAAPSAVFTPPTSITVEMYRLDDYGASTGVLCTNGDTAYGCTVTPARPYPYATNPVNISIETDYLLDVVPQEMNPSVCHAVGVQAQAIAVRTYAYFHIHYGSTINNSTEFQVFIPYRFESLTPATDPNNPADPCASSNLNSNQQAICTATASRYYFTYYNQESPARSEFFSDRQLRTLTHPSRIPYIPTSWGWKTRLALFPQLPTMDMATG